MTEQNELEHYGVIRRSGRYPWGSGGDPYQRSKDFYGIVDELRSQGLSDKEIADSFSTEDHPFTVTQLKQTKSIARNQIRAADASFAMTLKNKGMSNTEIGARMGGINESSVRSLLDASIAQKQRVLETTIEMLRGEADDKKFIDIGKATELYAGVSRDRLMTAVAVLESEGYKKFWVNQPTGLGNNKTTVMVLARPGAEYPELIADPSQIKLIGSYSENKGESFSRILPPRSLDSSRLAINYGADGAHSDGLIEVRRGVPELDMGKAKYSQVRILVDGTHYLKGMAVTVDDLPAGVDVRFNTPKEKGANKLDALKPALNDKQNPFGAEIKRQATFIDKNGKEQITAINIVSEEGDWAEWSKTLSSQMLSKQPYQLAEKQLSLFRDKRQNELESIVKLTNPTLKQELLRSFSEKVDSDAVDLKALGLPGTASQVLIPVPKMKETEIYAPNYDQGTRVALVRHPHGGIFEIPSLIVNNNNPAARKLLGPNPIDAVGINAKVAEQLSGADFDGDTVLVIPNNHGLVKTSRPLDDLVKFAPREQYKHYDGMKVMKNTQAEMGMISNLITDMQVKNAPQNEVARAVRHSMVVIDAEKHKLNYKQSYDDNGIAALKKEYQTGGASTLISRASADIRVPKTKGRPAAEGGPIDKATGEKRFVVDTHQAYVVEDVDKVTGKVTQRTIQPNMSSTRMRETRDARTLMSSKTGTAIERVYADHANQLKAMGNQARKEMVSTPNLKRSPSAAKTYAAEVQSLMAQVRVAQMNKPKERQAQLIAAAKAKARIEADPAMDKDKQKKVRTQEIKNARHQVGADKVAVSISPREWEAIQAGAIAHTPLREVFNYADPVQIKEYATPREQKGLSGPSLSRARGMLLRGYTQADVAQMLGVSVSTIQEILKK